MRLDHNLIHELVCGMNEYELGEMAAAIRGRQAILADRRKFLLNNYKPSQAVMDWVVSGHGIQAIKQIRVEMTHANVGLEEAKMIYDGLKAKHIEQQALIERSVKDEITNNR